MNNEYLTPQDVANALKICPKTVLKMIKEGRLNALEIVGKERKTYRILAGELDRFAAREYEKSLNGKEAENG